MKFFIAVVVLATISLVGSRVTFLNRRLPIGFRHILLTGTEYIFIGLLLGGLGLNILDSATLVKLEVILLFGLVWIGFLFGLQFEIRLLRNLPRFYFSITVLQALVTFVFVSLATYLLLGFYTDFPRAVVWISSITLGATASCTAQSAIAIVNKNYTIQNKGLLGLMRYISAVDGLMALCFFTVALAIYPGEEIGKFQLLASMQWVGGMILSGVVPALVLIVFSRSRFSPQEYSLFLIGTILFCGGLAHQFQFSPLVSGLIFGIITANFCRHRLRGLQIVVQAEKSIYILLLLVIGAMWQFKLDHSLLIAVVYFLFKVFGKTIGVFLATRIYKPKYEVPAKLGLGLISEGGLVVAMILNFKYLYSDYADTLVTIMIFSVLLSEFLSPRLIVAQFKKSEIAIKQSLNGKASEGI